jgi:hypothetical protein
VKCKVELLTGLDEVTSPKALWRIWKHFTDRIALRIYTRNAFHANVYIFDLPFRKSVAYVGSGNLTLDGLKDREEVFYKVTDVKEIEALKSWFVGFYEFGEPISEEIIKEYDLVYPTLMRRSIESRQEKEEALAIASRGFSWDQFKFRTQYFKREDYLVLSNEKAASISPIVQAEREPLRDKLLQLHEALKRDIALLKLSPLENTISTIVPDGDAKIKELSLSYGRRQSEMNKFALHVTVNEFLKVQIVLRQKELSLRLVVGIPGVEGIDRAYFHQQMLDEPFRISFFKNLTALGAPYWIDSAGKQLDVTSFKDEKALHSFTQSDDHRFSTLMIGRAYHPGDATISQDHIATTLAAALGKLMVIYEQLKRI